MQNRPFFETVETIRFAGPDSDDPFTYRWYDADRDVLGRRMEDHLRMAVCYWHSFVWPGSDVFGDGTFDRPWNSAEVEPMEGARAKLAAAFEFFEKLGLPYFTFHDRDIAPEGTSFRETCRNLDAIADDVATAMDRTGVKLLWGTANLFSHPRYAAGAATNPDPELFARAAAQVCQALDVTHRLGGENYVLWGGREGYDTLLNTDMGRELDQLGRFLHLVVEHKHRIGFEGTLLIEPKPSEPTKHQYDFDAATVAGFLHRYDLGEIKVNLEANHATLGGHSFHHEVASAIATDVLGSIDANRGDAQNGWDTDQFPNSVEEVSLVMYEILRNGGLGTGGFNFDTKLRRQSMDRDDLFHGHIGAVDTLARSLLVAGSLIESDELEVHRRRRYEGWEGALGTSILEGSVSLPDLRELVVEQGLEPAATSGRQELLENVVNRHIDRVR